MTSYAYCLATTNNTSCDTTWQSVSAATTATVANLTPEAVYFWQVRAQNGAGTTEATGGPWMFTVAAPAPSPVTKNSPANGPTGVGRSVTLSWSTTLTAPNHWVCWDTSNNGTCNFMWWPTGTTPSHTLTGLASGTYYWQVRADAGSGPIEGDGGTWWAFTVAPAPTAVTVVPWGTTQTWIRWENEADDMSDFHVERSTDGGAWSEIVQQGARSYLDASPTCGPVAYRVRAHWHGTNQFSEYGNVANVRACAPLAPGPLAVASWYGGTLRLTWEDRSGDESDFHVERQVDGGAWQAAVTLGADSQAWVDEAPPCGVVGYRVRTHRHDSNQYSDYTNVASITRSCFDAMTGMSAAGANTGRGGGPPIGRMPAAAWLALVTLVGVTLTGWQRRFRPAKRVATLALAALVALLWPAAAAAQSAIEYYHTDALGSVRAVTSQVNGEWQVVNRHDFMPFGEEVTPPSPPPPEKRLFTGKERDQETGLDYFEARYLRGGNGRFTTVDPISVDRRRLFDPEQLNLYTYARNNPLRFQDPTGLCTKKSDATKDTAAGDVCQAPSGLTVNAEGKTWIASKEKTWLFVYEDPIKILTVGIGHKVLTTDKLKLGDKITEERMATLFDADIADAEESVRDRVGSLELSQNEFNALTDLVFNAGPGVLGQAMSPNLVAAIASADYQAMSEQLLYSKDVKGGELKGLVLRSGERKKMFLGTFGKR